MEKGPSALVHHVALTADWELEEGCMGVTREVDCCQRVD